MSKLFTVFILLPLFCIGQKQGNIWYFGNHAGLDFNTTPPTPLLNGQTDFHFPNGFNEGSSSICDSMGTLLVYTNGEKLWNNQHQIIPNGDSLMGHSSTIQSSVIVPLPDSQRYFYVFTIDGVENNYRNGLRYSIIDMCLGGGKGGVMTSSKNILLMDTVSEKLLCIKHSNGSDYWIVSHKYKSDVFYSIRLTSNGILDTVISHVGGIDSSGWGGQMSASQTGDKIAYLVIGLPTNGSVNILDFDLSNGILSNAQTISTGSCNYGSCFSPDGTKLYTTSSCVGEIVQYNLIAGNLSAIIASKTTIIQSGGGYYYAMMQVGTDGKIYIAKPAPTKKYLSVITLPNNSGSACIFIDSAIYLGGQDASLGLPNFIVGYNYANTIVDCSTGVSEENPFEQISAFPNPLSVQTTFQTHKVLKNATLTLYNASGQQVKQIINLSGQTITLCRDNLPGGLYYFQLTEDNQIISIDKLVITNH